MNQKRVIAVAAMTGLMTTGVLQASNVINVAVFDFLTPDAKISSYLATAEDSPATKPPEDLLSATEIGQLPEEDRLIISRRQQEQRQKWQNQVREIELRRYKEGIEACAQVRDVLMKTEYGRSVLGATPVMEAELAKYPDVFRIFTRRSGEQAQINLNIEQDELMQKQGAGELIAPTHFIEGQVGNLMHRDTRRVQGSSTIVSRLYQLPVTIKLIDSASREVISIYDAIESDRDRATGRAVKRDDEMVSQLIRSAVEKAAAKMYKDLKPVSASPAADDPVSIIKKLQMMRDEGLITEEEFQVKRKEILDRM